MSPPDQVMSARSRAYPLKPLVRLPFYGLPYDFVDTTTGRLAFEIEDLSLPGRMPIRITRTMDSGGPIDFPIPLPDRFSRYGADLGPSWSFSYTDYLQATSDGYVLAKAEGGPIKFVPDSPGSTTYKLCVRGLTLLFRDETMSIRTLPFMLVICSAIALGLCAVADEEHVLPVVVGADAPLYPIPLREAVALKARSG